MKIVDSKGKLFGKINLVDFLILVMVLALVSALALRSFLPLLRPVEKQLYQIEFWIEEAPQFVQPYLNEEGVLLKDFDKATVLGTLLQSEIGPAVTYAVNQAGQSVKTSKPDYISARIYAEGEGILTPNGLVLGGLTYPIGRSLTLIVGRCAVYGRIAAITPLEAPAAAQ